MGGTCMHTPRVVKRPHEHPCSSRTPLRVTPTSTASPPSMCEALGRTRSQEINLPLLLLLTLFMVKVGDKQTGISVVRCSTELFLSHFGCCADSEEATEVKASGRLP